MFRQTPYESGFCKAFCMIETFAAPLWAASQYMAVLTVLEGYRDTQVLAATHLGLSRYTKLGKASPAAVKGLCC